MVGFQKLSLELKSSVFFGAMALIVSSLSGIVSGISFVIILLRLFIFIPVFAGIGFGIMVVLKRFIPELYEAFNTASNKIDNLSEEISEDDLAGEGENVSTEPSGPPQEGGFTEFQQTDFEHMETGSTSDMDSSLNLSEGKMGKHIVVNEKFAKYEPKIMAEAVRTMMSKDEE